MALISCKDNIVVQKEVPVIISVKNIIPAEPLKIGQEFKMEINVQNLDNVFVDYHYYVNNQFHYDNYSYGDTIFSYVPYLPINFNN